MRRPGVSYNQALKGAKRPNRDEPTPEQTLPAARSTLENMMLTLMHRMDAILNMLTTLVSKIS